MLLILEPKMNYREHHWNCRGLKVEEEWNVEERNKVHAARQHWKLMDTPQQQEQEQIKKISSSKETETETRNKLNMLNKLLNWQDWVWISVWQKMYLKYRAYVFKSYWNFNVVANYCSAETKAQCTVLVNGKLFLSVTNLLSGKQAQSEQRFSIELYRKFGW